MCERSVMKRAGRLAAAHGAADLAQRSGDEIIADSLNGGDDADDYQRH